MGIVESILSEVGGLHSSCGSGTGLVLRPRQLYRRFKPGKYFLRVLVEDLLFVLRTEPGNAFDLGLDVVVPLVAARIFFRACAGALGAEQAAVRAYDFEQELQRFDVVKRRVEIKLLETLVEGFGVVWAAELRAPTPNLVRYGAAAVADDQL